jgi:aminopeptidase YwaD
MLRRLILPLIALALVACSSSTKNPSTERAATLTAATVAAASTATPEPAAVAATPAPTTAAAPASAEPSGEQALAHARVLAVDIGQRAAGSAGEAAAVAYIAGQLRSFGYEVELQPFPVKSFFSRKVEFKVLAPNVETLRVSPLTNSPPGTATGELFSAGLGLPADYPSGGIGGRIALVQRGQLEFGEKLRNAAAAGASALVMFDPPNDIVPGRLTGQLPSIPALVISGPDGVRLRDALTGGPISVALSFDGGTEEHTATNVIGRSPGKGCSAVVGGHFDTVNGTSGASDNASGTAAVLEMARVQALRGNPEQACFIAFSGEELGLLGSLYYVEHLSPADRQALRFMLNFDMVSVGDQWLFIGSSALQRRGQEVAEATGIAGRRADFLGGSSDYAAFIDRRIPALWLHRAEDSLLHTPQDTFDRLSAAPMETAVRLGLAWLTAFSQS